MSVLDKIKSMRQDAKSKETRLISNKSRGGFVSVGSLDEGKTTLRIVKHKDDPIPFIPFRSTWLEVEEKLENLYRGQMEKIIIERKLERALNIKKVDDLKDVEDDKLRGMLADELGADFTQLVNKRIFISKVHGNPDIPDVIEEYIKFAGMLSKTHSQDAEDAKRMLAPVRGWRGKDGKWNSGIMPSTNYICKILLWDEGDKPLKRFEMWDKHMTEIEKLYAAFDDPDEPLTIDPFSDPKEGVPVIFEKFKNDKGKFDFNVTDKKIGRGMGFDEFVKQFELTKDQINEIDETESLSSIYQNSYSKRAFELALSGLQIFDEKHKIGVMEHDEFIDILEQIAKYYENEPTEEAPAKEEKKEPAKPKATSERERKFESRKTEKKEEEPEPEEKAEEEGESSPYGATIEELEDYIEKNDYDIKVLRRDTFEKIVDKIEKYESELTPEDDKGEELPPEDEQSEEQDDSLSEKEAAEKPKIDITSLRDKLNKRRK